MCLAATGVVTRIRDDDGIPMALIAADSGTGAGDAADTVSACLLTCPEAAVGDTVLIHSGYVLEILDPGHGPAPREDP